MAKKNKKENLVVEVSSEIASIDSNDSVIDGSKKKKKKKKERKLENNNAAVESPCILVNGDGGLEKSSLDDSQVKSIVNNNEKQLKKKKKLNSLSNVDKPRTETSVVRSSKSRLKDDLSYIEDFLSDLHIPNHKKDQDEELDEFDDDEESREEKEKRVKPGGTTRAASNQELRERLQAKLEELRGRKLGANESKRQKKLKRKLASIEKKKLAGEELKQKLMKVGKNASNLNKVINKETESLGVKVNKPGVKTEKGVVFSKFDFKDDMAPAEVKKKIDPKVALEKLKQKKEKVKLWEEKGKLNKAQNIENNIAWDNALGKAQGEKIKDDESLLKKSIKKQKQIKKSSKKKWDSRAENVKAKEAAFVEKRESNMLKRKKDKHAKKMKTLVARGRHVPGS